ncbi:hypothetical protein BJ944DRAFT_120007 [Cunninghamella echinulata]|nr:hypothetical protein BJ944DRAFT_120007 [Cunninghamella echinulata]
MKKHSTIFQDQKSFKKNKSNASSTKRMQRWRAANRDKNKMNDLRCRVYKLARKKFQHDCLEKENFIKEQIAKRLQKTNNSSQNESLLLLPFYNQPRHEFELPFVMTHSYPLSHPNLDKQDHHHPSSINLPPIQSFFPLYCYPINLPLLLQPNPIQ